MSPFFAYLDAGSGALLLQLIIGGAAGVAAFIKIRWRNMIGNAGGTSESTGSVEALGEAGERTDSH